LASFIASFRRLIIASFASNPHASAGLFVCLLLYAEAMRDRDIARNSKKNRVEKWGGWKA
jgi:hypothetical protein